jgi:hypothetical protein
VVGEGLSRRLEFWPDYGGRLLHEDGRAVPVRDLPIPPELVVAAETWVARYADEKLLGPSRDAS